MISLVLHQSHKRSLAKVECTDTSTFRVNLVATPRLPHDALAPPQRVASPPAAAVQCGNHRICSARMLTDDRQGRAKRESRDAQLRPIQLHVPPPTFSRTNERCCVQTEHLLLRITAGLPFRYNTVRTASSRL